MSFPDQIDVVDIAPEALKAEIDQKYLETPFDLRLGQEQVRIPEMLTYRNLSVSGVDGNGRTSAINSLLHQLRAMSNQKCLIVDINGYYCSKFSQAGDKVLVANDPHDESDSGITASEFFAETLAKVNQDDIFFSAGDQALSIFSLIQSATSSSNEWVFLIVPVYDLDKFSPMLKLWVELVILGVLQRDTGSDYPHFWLIADDLVSLGKLPDLEILLAQARKYKASMVAGYQIATQLENIYGRLGASAIIHGFDNKICFRNPLPIAAAEIDLPTREIQSLPDLQAYLKIHGFAPTRIQFDAFS